MTGPTDETPPERDPASGPGPDRPMLGLVLAYQRRAWRRGERASAEA